MRVAYVCPTRELYGDNIALLNIMPRLAARGVEPLFVFPYADESPMWKRVVELGFPVVKGKTFQGATWSNGLLGFLRGVRVWLRRRSGDYRSILDAVRSFKPDLIHTNNSFSCLGRTLSQDLKLPNVQHVREYGIPDARRHYFPCLAYQRRALQGERQHPLFITEDIRQYFRTPESRSAIVHDGVLQARTPIKRENLKDGGYLLFVGRITQVKGIFEIVRVFLQFCDGDNSGLTLKIAGGGPADEVERLTALIQGSPDGHRIEYLGYRTDIPELMANARALVVASRFEAFGFISVEAMAAGCPVIGRDKAGTKMQFDALRDYSGHDIALRFTDSKGLLEAFKKMSAIDKSGIADDLLTASRFAYDTFPVEKSADAVYDNYLKILSSSGSAAS